MLEQYEEYLERTKKKDCKLSWIDWKMEVFQYSKEKAFKRAESQYFPLSKIDMEQTLIGLNIKYLRKKKNLTQVEMNDILKLDKMLLMRWEKGIYIPDSLQTQMLADFFEVSVSDLINKRLFDEK